jgi:hypothetical protein
MVPPRKHLPSMENVDGLAVVDSRQTYVYPFLSRPRFLMTIRFYSWIREDRSFVCTTLPFLLRD